MLGANCSDEPNQTPSALFPNTHIFLGLQADARVMCSFRRKRARVLSDVTQINAYPLNLDVLLLISTSSSVFAALLQ